MNVIVIGILFIFLKGSNFVVLFFNVMFIGILGGWLIMKFVILKFLIVMLVKFVYELIKLLYLNKIFLFLVEFLILYW